MSKLGKSQISHFQTEFTVLYQEPSRLQRRKLGKMLKRSSNEGRMNEYRGIQTYAGRIKNIVAAGRIQNIFSKSKILRPC